MVWLIIDLAVAAAIIIMTVIYAKRGFVRTVIETAGFIAAIIIAMNLGNVFADVIYDKAIEPKVITAFSSFGEDTAESATEKLWDKLPEFLKSESGDFGISKDAVLEALSVNTDDGIIAAAENMSDTVIYPIVAKLLSAILALILFLILLFIVRIIAKIINKLFSFKLIGKLNTTLGGAMGLIKGTAIMALVCSAIALAVSFTTNGILIFTNENIAATYLFEPLSKLFIK